MTSTSTWHSWNGTATATYSSVVTATTSIPVEVTYKGEGLSSNSFSRVFVAALSLLGTLLLGL